MPENRIKNIKDSWMDIKSDINQYWKKLSMEDLDEIEGSYYKLIDKVEKAYQLNREEATAKVNEYIEKLGFDDPSSQLVEFNSDAANEKIRIAKENFEKSILASVSKMRNSSVCVYENITEYIRANPLKLVSIAVLAGIVTGKFLSIN